MANWQSIAETQAGGGKQSSRVAQGLAKSGGVLHAIGGAAAPAKARGALEINRRMRLPHQLTSSASAAADRYRQLFSPLPGLIACCCSPGAVLQHVAAGHAGTLLLIVPEAVVAPVALVGVVLAAAGQKPMAGRRER